MKKIFLLLVILLSGELMAGVRAATPTPQSTDPSSWWCQRFEKKCIDLKEKGAPLLLVGDDVTQMWEENGKGLQPFRAYLQKEPMSAVDIGYTGDRTENVLWRLQNGELDGYEPPKAALIMVGANNTLDFTEDEEPPCDTILGIRSIIDTIKERCPDTKIFVFSILPCGRTPNDQRRTRNFNVNAALSRLCEPLGATFYEINSQVMDIDGNFGEDFSYDGIHLNTKGYKVWVKNITKLLNPIFFPEETPSYKLPVSRFGEPWWYERVFAIRSAIGTTTTRPNVVILGDDLAKGWEEQGAEAAKECFGSRRLNNAGIEGDSLAQIIWRARYSCLSAFRPALVVLQAGLVDSEITAEEFIDAYKDLVTEARSKQTASKIIIMAVPPRGASPNDPMRERIEAINDGLEKLVTNDKTFFVNCNEELLEPDGTLSPEMSPDQIHFSAEAYEIWGKAIQEILNN